MKTVEKIKKKIENIMDINYKKINILNKEIYLFYNSSLTDSDKINDHILKSINSVIINVKKTKDIKKYLYNIIPSGNINIVSSENILNYLMDGHSVLVIDDKESISIQTKNLLDRGISESTDERILRGSKDAFCETLNKNAGLIRKRIKSNDLFLKLFSVGKYSKTTIALMYISSIVDMELVNKIVQRIENINVDGIIDSGYIRELIFDDQNILFPTIMSTERPDKASTSLLEGKVVILVDNSPYVLILPSFFIDYFKVTEDYYMKSFHTSFNRILRLICFLISLTLPAIYIALTTYNKESIPTVLLMNFSIARSSVPFPAVIESILIIIIFEILKESDTRLPSILGNSVSILGAIILGEAAISAGIVSPIMLIVVALTLISSFAFTEVDFVSSIRWWRIIFLVFASFFGLYGIFLISILFIIKLCCVESIGKPYLYPFAPLDFNELKDSFIRSNKYKLNKRSKILTNNITRLRK